MVIEPDVMIGGSFTFATIIENDCVSIVPFTSMTFTVTEFGPTSLLVGVHDIMPVTLSITIPLGYVVKL